MTSLRRLMRRQVAAVGNDLRQEISTEPAWMYPFRLSDGSVPPLLHHELPSVHETRAAMMEPVLRAALERLGEEASAIDIACSEG